MLRIKSLSIFPVKSCAGFEVTQLVVTPLGVLEDRKWQFISSETHRFLTQRQLPKMALIRTHLKDNRLTVTIPGNFPCTVEPNAGKPFQVQTWSDLIPANDCGDEIAHKASYFFKQDVRLVQIDDGRRRPVKEKYLTQRQGTVPLSFGFADSLPLLVVTESSLKALGSVDSRRFRANIVVEGEVPPFAENHWRTLEVSSSAGLASPLIRFGQHCTRCPIIDINPENASRYERSALKELLQINPIDQKPVFGIRCFMDFQNQELAVLQVGDQVNVLALEHT